MTVTDAAPRWHQRVLPVTGLALALLALAALLVPAVRQQVLLSATHRPQSYVELSLSRDARGVPVRCAASGSRVRVRFDVTSHLRDDEEVAYVVTVRGAKVLRRTGRVPVAPGETARVTERLRRPSHRYVVEVRLPGRDQRLSAHCPRRPA